MAGYDTNDLHHEMGALSIADTSWKELGLNDNIRTQLSKIENDYESIFSWSITRLTGANQNLMSNLIDIVREQLEIITATSEKSDEFQLNRFYLQLVMSYELYNSKRYKESYLEIKRVVKFLETCKFDKSNEQYLDAYRHIAWATNAYIALTLKIDSENFARPLFDVGRSIKPNEFLDVLLVNTQESVLDNEWGEEEKKTIENAFNRFNQILQIKIEY